MSEERRKRQQGRDGATTGANSKNILIYGGIFVLLAAAYYAGWYHKNHKYDAFAQCLATKQVKMYGLSWCSHCQDQKAMFGAAFHYVPYVECVVKDSSEVAPECKVAGVKQYPSWQFGMDPPKEGILSMETLSDKTGCGLP